MVHRKQQRLIIAALVCLGAVATAEAQQDAKLGVAHIDMKPTNNGFYDATVGLIATDPKLGKTGRVAFDIVIAHVHDADEAIAKVHDTVRTLSGDLQAGYKDLHREP